MGDSHPSRSHPHRGGVPGRHHARRRPHAPRAQGAVGAADGSRGTVRVRRDRAIDLASFTGSVGRSDHSCRGCRRSSPRRSCRPGRRVRSHRPRSYRSRSRCPTSFRSPNRCRSPTTSRRSTTSCLRKDHTCPWCCRWEGCRRFRGNSPPWSSSCRTRHALGLVADEGRVPPGLGTQGLPLQQSALVAHAVPPSCAVHVGAPRDADVVLPAGRVLVAEARAAVLVGVAGGHHELAHVAVGRASHVLLAVAAEQTTAWPDVGRPASMRACEPQHSLSLVQVSPSTWHPVAGWQTLTPVGPQGPHARLQHEPPQPPSRSETGMHSWPSTCVQLPPKVNWPQVPMVRRWGWCTCRRSSRCWGAHVARLGAARRGLADVAAARPEQQSPLAVHALPSVLQLGLSAAHLPGGARQLQHWLLPVHEVPSEMHAGKPQTPWQQVPLQHAPLEAHPLPSEMHPPSLPNGPPESPTPTEPLLLPLPLPPLLLSVPLLLPEPLLLLEVASPPSVRPFAPEPLLLPQAMNEPPEPRPAPTATHTTSAVRRRTMRGTVHASFQGPRASTAQTWPGGAE